MKNDNSICIRCNSDLKELLNAEADRIGFSLSKYLLYCAVKELSSKGEKSCQETITNHQQSMEAQKLVSTYTKKHIQ